MSTELVTKVVEVLSSYTAGETFLSNQGNQVAIAYHENVVPPREQGAEDIPACWVHRRTFSIFPRPMARIEAEFLLCDDSDTQAEEEAKRLFELLNGLQAKKQFSPWKLDAAGGYEGDQDSGLHPPEYRIYTYQLDFSGAL